MLCQRGVNLFRLAWIWITCAEQRWLQTAQKQVHFPRFRCIRLSPLRNEGPRTHLDLPIARCQIVMKGVQTKDPCHPSPFTPLDAKRCAPKSLGWQSEVVGKTTMRNSSAGGGGGGRKGHRVIRNSIVGGSVRGAACLLLLLLLPPCRTVQPAVASPTRPPTPSITPAILLWTRQDRIS